MNSPHSTVVVCFGLSDVCGAVGLGAWKIFRSPVESASKLLATPEFNLARRLSGHRAAKGCRLCLGQGLPIATCSTHVYPHCFVFFMAVNEHRPAVADVKFDVKEGSSICSATFVFGYVGNLNLNAHAAPALLVACSYLYGGPSL